MIGRAHTLSMGLLRVEHEGTSPELDVMKNGPRLYETSPVHVLEDSNAVHGNDRAKTEANQSDRFSLGKV